MATLHHLQTATPISDAGRRLRHVFVRDLVLPAAIGVYDRERGRAQKVRINIDLSVEEGEAPLADSLDKVVCYQAVIDRVRAIVDAGHINLVETLAERIAAAALAIDQVAAARIRVEKLEAVPDAASVGVEIERRRSPIS